MKDSSLADDIIAQLNEQAKNEDAWQAKASLRAARRVKQLGLPDAVLAMDMDENASFLKCMFVLMESESND